MATFYLRTSNYGAKKSAASNASYICGLGKYADKDEVSHIEANNLPDFAQNDPQAFFKTAQEQEKERSARGFVFAIPEEAKDRAKWASNFAKELCGNAPYLLAVHEKDGNPHAHILMSERTLDLKKSLKKNATKPVDPSKLSEEKFFSRVNGKNRDFSRVDFLDQAKEKYLTHIRQVAPNYTPQNKGEIKIGPNLKYAGETYKEQREERARAVQELRDTQREILQVQTKLNTAQTAAAAAPQPKPQEQPTGKPQPKTEGDKAQLLMTLEKKKLEAQAQLSALPPTASIERVRLMQKIDQVYNEINKIKQAKPEEQKQRQEQQNNTKTNYGQQPDQQKQQEQVKNNLNNDKSNRDQSRDMDARARESLRKQEQDLRTTNPNQGLNHHEIQRREAMAKETQQQQNATAKAQPTFADGREQSRLYQYTKERADKSPEITNLFQMLNHGSAEFVKHAENVFNKTGGQGLSMAQRLKDTSNTLAQQITAAATPSAPANTSAAKTKASADGWKKFRPAPPSPFRK